MRKRYRAAIVGLTAAAVIGVAGCAPEDTSSMAVPGPSQTPEVASTPSATPSSSVSASPTPSASPSATVTQQPLTNFTPSPTPTPTPSARPSASATPDAEVTMDSGDNAAQAAKKAEQQKAAAAQQASNSSGQTGGGTAGSGGKKSSSPAPKASKKKQAKVDSRCEYGEVLCISKSSNTMHFMRDGEIISTVDVRFGKESDPSKRTREGNFLVFRKEVDHTSNLYDSEMPYSMFFSGGQAVHYSSDFAARGYNGNSHGCVNVRDKGALADIFSQVKVMDTRVVVYS